jgi:undecaprenyl diphosphate synthase
VSFSIESQSLETFLKNHPNIPLHIGIIMDGNGRWAKRRGLPRITGHNAGIEAVRKVVEACGEVGVKVLTLFTFSRENWKRPPIEVSALMTLLLTTINREINELIEKNVKIQCIGNLNDLPVRTKKCLCDAIYRTADNTGLILNLAISYGSRSEITDAVVAIARNVKTGQIEPEDIDQSLIKNFLQTSDLPDPDLIIRTSGEFRISNFLLWQIAYSEIYVTDALWPDFGRKELFQAIYNYLNRERRFGMVTEQINSSPAL